MAGAAGIRAGLAYVELGVNDNALSRGLLAAQARLQAFAAAAKQVGMQMLTASAAMGLPLAAGANVYADFEQSMARVKAIVKPTEEEFAALSKEAEKLGRETIFSAGQAAQAMGELAQAGYKTNDILAASGPILNLAATGQLELADAAKIAIGVMAGMKIPTSDLSRTIDVMAKASVSAKMTLVEFGDSMKYVGPAAVAAGISLEEVAAAIEVLSNAGMQGDMAGTTLRGAILSLYTPTVEAKKTMDQLGVSTKTSTGKVRNFADILEDLEAGLDKLESGDRMTAIGTLFPDRQAVGILTLTQKAKVDPADTENLQKAVESLANPTAAAQATLDQLGMATTDATGRFRGFTDVLADLESALAKLDSGKRSEAIETLFPGQGKDVEKILAKPKGGTRELRDRTTELRLKAEGESARIAAIQMNTLKGALELFWSSLEGLGIVIGKTIAPVLREWGAALVDVLSYVTTFTEANRDWLPIIAKVALGLGLAGTALIAIGTTAGVAAFAIGGLAASWAILSTGFTVAAVAIGAAMSPLGAMAVSVGSMVAEFATLENLGQLARDAFGILSLGAIGAASAIGIVVEAVRYLGSMAIPALSLLGETGMSLKGVLGTLAVAVGFVGGSMLAYRGIMMATGIATAAWSAATAAASVITVAFSGAVGLLTGTLGVLAGVLAFVASPIGLVVAGLAAAGAAVWYFAGSAGVLKVLKVALGAIVVAVGVVGGAIYLMYEGGKAAIGLLSEAFFGLVDVAGSVAAGVSSKVGSVFGGIYGLVKPVVDYIGGAFSGLAGSLTRVFDGVAEGIGNAFTGLTDTIGQMGATFGKVWDGIVKSITAGDFEAAGRIAWAGMKVVWQQGVNWLNASWRGFTAYFAEAYHGTMLSVAKVFNNVWSGVEKAWFESFALIGSAWGALIDFMTKTFNAAYSAMAMQWNALQFATLRITHKEFTEKNEEIAKAMFTGNEKVNAERKTANEKVEKDRQEIESRRQAVEDSLTGDHNRGKDSREAERTAAKAADLAALAKAQKELDDAIASIGKTAENDGLSAMQKKKGLPESIKEMPTPVEIQSSADKAMGVGSGGSAGSFDAATLRFLGGTGKDVTDKENGKKLDETVKWLQKVFDVLKDGTFGAVYTP